MAPCAGVIRASIFLRKGWIAGSSPGNDECGTTATSCRFIHPDQEIAMTLTVAHITPLVALIAGILILIMPRLLNFIVAIYLIIVGLTGLNGIYHFFH
jgi:hypothetical protein